MQYLIPTLIFIVAVFFLVRHIRKSFKGEVTCHGNCMECQKRLQEEFYVSDESVSKKSSKIMKQKKK